MAVNTKRVFYVKYLAAPDYEQTLARRPDVRLDKLENETAEEAVAPVLAAAHAYQIGSARDEIATRFHADAALLKRTPNLLIVSTNGVGYDTVNVKDCTGAGVLVVYLAGVSAVAFTLWSLLLKHNPVGSVAVFNFEIPIFGAILAALVLGESVLEWKNLVALVLVSIGIWLVTTKGRSAAVSSA